MARLIVKLHGQEVTNLKLEPGQEYIAGRAPDAQIRLGEERGISRQHLKFYERDGAWVCETLSKFVLIQIGSDSAEVIELVEAGTFSLPPYEFYYDPEVAPAQAPEDVANPAAVEPAGDPAPAASSNLPVFYNPRVNMGETREPANPNDTSPKLNNEATKPGALNLVPYFRISYPNTADDEVLKLEGHIWVAGRETGCEIYIDSPHISRRHFELARTKEGFFITDLGSSNGTKVNGSRIPAHEPTKVDSGDEISIMNISMSFEIRDLQFSNRLESLPVPAFDPILVAPPQWQAEAMGMGGSGHLPAPYVPQGPVPLKKRIRRVNWKKNKVRIILILATPLLLIGLLDNPKPKDKNRDVAASGNSVSFENLTAERKNVVKDSFHLARNLYVQGKYALCLTELAKVHEIIPQFENSKELASFCEQGLELTRQNENRDRLERERAMIEQQITGYVEGCKQTLSPTATVDETKRCLDEARNLAPEHPLIIEMINTAQMHEEEAKFMKAQKEAEVERMQKGFAHYSKAEKIYKKGHLADSIAEFEKYLRTEYPRNGDKKEEARRQIASIKKELLEKVSKFLTQCKELGQKNEYKQAYMACDKATNEDKDNEEAKDLKEKMLNELRRKMKAIYEDSVLEESLGNVDTAKEKWKRILSEDLDFEDYAIKAKTKLQKYGSGL